MHIRLQSSVGEFDTSFVTALRKFESFMQEQGLDPSLYVISKDRPQFTSLPFFIRPGGDGFNYTVFVDGQSFTVTKANDLAFLEHFERLCAGAIYGHSESSGIRRSIGNFFARIAAWFNTPIYEKPARKKRRD